MRLDTAAWVGAALSSLAVAFAVSVHHDQAPRDPPAAHPPTDLKITILSTMLAESGIGEWGFSALVEVDGKKILFDTGRFSDTVIRNAKTLHIDLATIDEFVLSHHHADHTGGFLAIRDAVREKHPSALAKAHVSRGFFWPRRGRGQEDGGNPMISARVIYEETGGEFEEHDGPAEIYPGVFLTGPVPRVHDEKTYGKGISVERPGKGWTEDDVPEDQSLVIDTDRGLVVLSGCGHAGIVNTLEYARKVVRRAHVYAAIGGFHLYQLPEEELDWTASKLASMGMENFLGAHCTGLEATYRVRSLLGLPRANAAVGAVGAWFDLESGLHPLSLAR